MKRSFLFVALLSVATLVSAQTMKVQSAYSDMKNGRLLNAKQNIDDACKDEKTSRESKTWNYAGLIYTQIVQALEDESTDKKTRKELKKLTETKEQICQAGMQNFRECLKLEKEANSNEFVKNSVEAMKVLCGYAFKYAGDVYNAGKYEESAKMFHQVTEDATVAQYKDIQLEAMFYEADCYRMLNQKDKMLDIYRTLAKENSPKAEVYLKIYADNKEKGDTTKAINALKKGVRMTAKDPSTNIVMKSTLASAYLWAGQQAEADKMVQELLAGGENDVKTLNSVANIYVDMGNAEKAEELFNKSLAIDAKQVDAYRGLGMVYFNKAVDENAAAEKLPPDPEFDAEYNAHKMASFEAFEKSVPNFTKVLEVKADDFNSLKALKTVYSQLQSYPKFSAEQKAECKTKYQEVSAKLNELIQK